MLILAKKGFQIHLQIHLYFTRPQIIQKIIVLIYVDDIIVTRNILKDVEEFISTLCKTFACRDLGQLRMCLSRFIYDIISGQVHKDILNKFGFNALKSCSNPMVQSLKLSEEDGDLFEDVTLYKSLLSCL